MWQEIVNNYSQFFNLQNFEGVFTANGILTIMLLCLLEGLLSADNALVLAMMVKHLPEKERGHALTYGIWGAYLFRFAVIGIGTLLIKFTWIKALGAAYLLYMAIKGLVSHGEDNEGADQSNSEPKGIFAFISKFIGNGLWGTVLAVEGMDIVFSIDSVTAALAVSDRVWVLFLGAVIGIAMMRGVARVFVKLIEKVPELEKTAYVLIGIIGVKLALTLFHIEINDILFFAVMLFTFLSAFVINKVRNRATA